MAGEKPDFDLPWARLEGEPKDGPPRLNRQNLFLLACRDAFRNGTLSAAEKAFLGKFAAALQLTPEESRGFARLAKQESDEGKLAGEEDLDPKVVFKKACALAQAKGRLDADEREILGKFSESLGVSMMRVDSTLRQLAVTIDESARSVKTDIKLDPGRSMGGGKDAGGEWGEGDPLTRSGIGRLGIDLQMPGTPVPRPPTRPGAARIPDAKPAGDAEAPRPDLLRVIVVSGAMVLGGALMAVFGIRFAGQLWEEQRASVTLLAAAALAVPAGLALALAGFLKLARRGD